MPPLRSFLVVALTAALRSHSVLAQAGVTRHAAVHAPSTPLPIAQAKPLTYGSPLLITGQIIGGTLAAAGGGLMAWAIYDHPNGPDRRVRGDAGYTPNANTAYALGSFAGAVAATHLIGRIDGSRGNLLGTAIGAAILRFELRFSDASR